MQKQAWHTRLVRFLQSVTLVDVVVLMVVGAICWITGWHTLGAYGLGLMAAGLVVMGVGSSVAGTASLPTTAVLPLAGPRDTTQRRMEDMAGGAASFWVLESAGLVVTLFGALLWLMNP